MLGRFVCPAARLAELSPFVDELFRDGPPLAVSVLWTGGDTIREYSASAVKDVKAISDFQNGAENRASVEAWEFRPLAHLPISTEFDGILKLIASFLADSPVNPEFWYEFPSGPSLAKWLHLLPSAVSVEPTHCQGFKLRCGGAVSSATPTPDHIALAIASCVDAGVPMKFTAGLHHAMRHLDAQQGIHGFLNVFCAGVIAHAQGLDQDQLRLILEDTDPTAFHFDPYGLSWNDLRATREQIESARRKFVTSFGSCSFDEPRDDLRAMGLLP
jgi:hypothetical protein